MADVQNMQVVHKRRSMHDLPNDLLAGVLQHVNQEQRLTCCALVCKKWREVANIATCTVVAARNSKRFFQSLSAWLSNNRHAIKLQSIWVKHKAWPSVAPMLQLPFQRLTALNTLRLPCCLLKAAPEDQTAFPASPSTTASLTRAAGMQGTSLAALTALSRLRLGHTLLDLSELRCCTGLQHLELYYDEHMTAAENFRAAAIAGAAGTVVLSASSAWHQLAVALPQLTQLTHLAVKFTNMKETQQSGSLTSTVCLSSLQNLQQLRLGISSSSPIIFTHPPPSLTLLELSRSVNMDVCMPPLLQQLMTLQHLHLTYAWHPMLMSSLTNLTWLSFEEANFDTAIVVNMLMWTLQCLNQSRHLNLAYCLSEQRANEVLTPASYAALTSSSYLTFLDIRRCCFPEEVAEHIFPAADGLKDLKVLGIPSTPFNSAGSFNRMVACCPVLEQLKFVENSLRGTPETLSALSHLTALTRLVYKENLTDDAMRSIAACSQLKELTVDTEIEEDLAYGGSNVSIPGLELLTALTALSKLKLDLRCEGLFADHLLVSNSFPHDVHLQLQQLIAGKDGGIWPYYVEDDEDGV